MNKETTFKDGQTILVLDRKDIAFIVKEDGSHEAYISSAVEEDQETQQNYTAVLILAVLNNPEKYSELTKEILKKELDKKA